MLPIPRLGDVRLGRWRLRGIGLQAARQNVADDRDSATQKFAQVSILVVHRYLTGDGNITG
jgi:hypothetical protein